MGAGRPSERSKREMIKRGYLCGMAEKWVPFQGGAPGGFRKDLHGFIDIHCLRADVTGVTAVQATTRRQMSGHLREYRRTAEVREAILVFLGAGNTLLLHGWEKEEVGNKSGKGFRVRWVLREREITVGDLELTEGDRRVIAEREALERMQAT